MTKEQDRIDRAITDIMEDESVAKLYNGSEEVHFVATALILGQTLKSRVIKIGDKSGDGKELYLRDNAKSFIKIRLDRESDQDGDVRKGLYIFVFKDDDIADSETSEYSLDFPRDLQQMSPEFLEDLMSRFDKSSLALLAMSVMLGEKITKQEFHDEHALFTNKQIHDRTN